MPPITFLISNYLTRQDLERDILAEVGQDIEKNKTEGHLIKGTAHQLKQLQLDDTCAVFGCKVVSTYGSTKADLKEKLEDTGKQWK